MVIPKLFRDALGLVPGEVELAVDGVGVRIEPIITDGVIECEGRLAIAGGIDLDDDEVRALRFADQR